MILTLSMLGNLPFGLYIDSGTNALQSFRESKRQKPIIAIVIGIEGEDIG